MYRPGQRFDAGEAWLNRRTHSKHWTINQECAHCRSRRNVNPDRAMTKSEKAACRQTARHFADIYGLAYGKEVQSAAYVIQKIGRDAIRPVEEMVERRLRVDAKIHGARPTGRTRLILALRSVLTGRRLLRIVQTAIKRMEDPDGVGQPDSV